MSLNLKVNVPAQGATKVLRFAETMSVHEVCKQIAEKVNLGGKDHSLFLPTPDNLIEKEGIGRFLRPEKSLEFYDIKNNDTVQYRKKHETIKIKLVDDTVKTVLVDLSAPVSEIVLAFGERISLRNAEEFSLQPETKPGIWLKSNIPLVEQVTSVEQLFLLKKKFFMNDANLDQDDPVQLHLVYCQSRDDIVSGTHPVTKEEAISLAALQAQITSGDFKPDIHKTGYLSLKEFLAPQWHKKASDLEKTILQEWKKLVGMTDINARFRYVQLCRSLKTYGMTCFKVRERVPGKKKLMDAILAFTRDSILRMDYDTKTVIKEHPFKHLLRWAASPETFTMDFGAYEDEYIVVVTNEGEAISNLIAGYIDLLLKKQRDTGVVIEDDDGEVAEVTSVGRVGGQASASVTTNNVGGQTSYSQGVSDISSGKQAIDRMMDDMFGEVTKINDSNLTPLQRKQQLEQQARSLANLGETLGELAKTADRTAMNATAHKMTAALEQLITAARQAHASGADPDRILLDASKGIADALRNLLTASQNAANKPNDQEAKEALIMAQQAASAAVLKLTAASRGVYADESFQQLFSSLTKVVLAEALDLVGHGDQAKAGIADPNKKAQLQAALTALSASQKHFANITDILGPTAQDAQCKQTIEKVGKALEQNAFYVLSTARGLAADPKSIGLMNDASKRVAQALANLLATTDLPNFRGAKESQDFTEAAQAVLSAVAGLLAANGDPNLIKQQAGELKNAATRLGAAGKGIIAQQTDPASKERLANYLKNVVEGTKKLLQAIPAALQNPNDKAAQKALMQAIQEVTEATQQLIGDSGKQVAISALYSSATLAAAATTQLYTSARTANGSVNDPTAKQQLDDASRAASEAVQKLLSVLKNVNAPNKQRRTTAVRRQSTLNGNMMPIDSGASDLKDEVMQGCEQFAPVAYKLVSTAKTSSPKVGVEAHRNDLVYSSNNAAKAIHQMLANRKAMKAVKGNLEAAEAVEELKACLADIESALISVDTGLALPKIKEKDAALRDLTGAIQAVGAMAKQLVTVAKSSPEDIGASMKQMSNASTGLVMAVTALVATLDDKVLQKAILGALKTVTGDIKNLMQVSKATAANPDDANMGQVLVKSGKQVGESLIALTEASKGVVPKKVEDFQEKSANDIEDLAEKELLGAAAVIEKCVQKLQQATQAARLRAQEKELDIDQQNITEAILEAAQAIAKSTAVLITAATAVQQEFQKLVQQPETRAVYKRDPQWAQGLISAAKTVAGSVQHLVKAANDAAQGNASEEGLIVAAQAVSAATAQLVAASTVKADPNSESQRKLREASSRVSAATGQLVSAARAAAQWEEEQQQIEQDEKFNLTENKIREMEKQMEILRLEKELEKARNALGSLRKTEYKDANTEVSKGPTHQPSAPSPSAAPGSRLQRPAAGSPAQGPKPTPAPVPRPNPNANANPNPEVHSPPPQPAPSGSSPNLAGPPGHARTSTASGRPLPKPGAVPWKQTGFQGPAAGSPGPVPPQQRRPTNQPPLPPRQ